MQHWPVSSIVVETPRLRLAPFEAADLDEVLDAAGAIFAESDEVIFPWAAAIAQGRTEGTAQYLMETLGNVSQESWEIAFVVRDQGGVCGLQTLRAASFAVLRSVDTGSWLRADRHGRGYGAEMRAGVHALAVELGATEATSAALAENIASQRVSEKLGYRRNGTERAVGPAGELREMIRLRLSLESWRPAVPVDVAGLTGKVRDQLGCPAG